MKPDRQVIKQVELSLKFLAKDLRNGGAVDSSKVSAVAKLLDQYGNLIRLSRALEDESNNYYDRMERESLRDVSLKR